MDTTLWFCAEANAQILAILEQAPTEAIAIAGSNELHRRSSNGGTQTMTRTADETSTMKEITN